MVFPLVYERLILYAFLTVIGSGSIMVCLNFEANLSIRNMVAFPMKSACYMLWEIRI